MRSEDADQSGHPPVFASLSAWRNLGSLFSHWAHSEYSDQAGRMPRLIRVFAGSTWICWFCHEAVQVTKWTEHRGETEKLNNTKSNRSTALERSVIDQLAKPAFRSRLAHSTRLQILCNEVRRRCVICTTFWLAAQISSHITLPAPVTSLLR